MDWRVTAALDEMRLRLHDRLSVPMLAALVALSPSHFAHLFRRETGMAPMRQLQILRMEHARLLLERTLLPIHDVMAEVGYDDPSHFARHFRRHHGFVPRECRASRPSVAADRGNFVSHGPNLSRVAAAGDEDDRHR